MDFDLRVLERAVGEGDYTKRFALGRAFERAELPERAVPLYLGVLRDEPDNSEVLMRYVRAGGYCPQIVDGGIRHQNLVVNGVSLDVVVGDDLLDGGNRRTFDDWATYLGEDKSGVSILTTLAEGAIKRGMFGFVDIATGEVHPVFKDVVGHYSAVHSKNEGRWPLYGKLSYSDGSSALLEEFSRDKSVVSREINVPFLGGECAILASEQRVMGSTCVPAYTRELLVSLFGSQVDDTVKAFQYFSAKRDNNFREVGLWTPSAEGRRDWSERALVLGRDVNRFYIDCIVNIGNNRPALGWRSYEKQA